MSRKKEQGFTLIELLIVVAIIGILAAIAIPQFGKYKANAAKKAAISSIKQCVTEMAAAYAAGDGTTERIAMGITGAGDTWTKICTVADTTFTVTFDADEGRINTASGVITASAVSMTCAVSAPGIVTCD